MLKFDEEICDVCGGFGDCADGDCEDRLNQVIEGSHPFLDEVGIYEVTLRIPMTLGQRLEYGSPSQWDWKRLVDITVEECLLLHPSELEGDG
tara:strand:- start:1367 stop:1642 length:276 start_codon:yes stop_codon:yes gene_type:complete